eukprot:SAG31_NODE_10228_length_1167_cov_18.317416_1_plen_155_part_00
MSFVTCCTCPPFYLLIVSLGAHYLNRICYIAGTPPVPGTGLWSNRGTSDDRRLVCGSRADGRRRMRSSWGKSEREEHNGSVVYSLSCMRRTIARNLHVAESESNPSHPSYTTCAIVLGLRKAVAEHSARARTTRRVCTDDRAPYRLTSSPIYRR